VCKRRKDRETCHEKKVLSELAHFDSPFFLGLKAVIGESGREMHETPASETRALSRTIARSGFGHNGGGMVCSCLWSDRAAR
jgi:hypothetical protein